VLHLLRQSLALMLQQRLLLLRLPTLQQSSLDGMTPSVGLRL
jgi:hypothetical protein